MERNWLVALLCHMLLLLRIAEVRAHIDPENARNMTMYHVNPQSIGSLPINQDIGDLQGDLYWYLLQFLLPLECRAGEASISAKFDCSNAERAGERVATQVRLEVDQRFTTYSACNFCNITDPISKKPCQPPGQYHCDCFSPWAPGGCDEHRVGKESVYMEFPPSPTSVRCKNALQRACGAVRNTSDGCVPCIMSKTHGADLLKAGCELKDAYYWCEEARGVCGKRGGEEWMCWKDNLVRKTDGYWYSMLRSAMCLPNSTVGSCGWRAISTRTIQERCLRDTLINVIEAENRTCFSACGATRNESSSCWIGCVFDTVLGAEARRGNHRPLAGLPLQKLQDAWERAFKLERDAGCAAVDMHDADFAVLSELGVDQDTLAIQVVI